MNSPRLTFRAGLLAALLLGSVAAQAALQSTARSPNTFPAPLPSTLATARVAAVRVDVAPERAGWTYEVGEPVRFVIHVTSDKEPLAGARLRYKVGPEMMPAPEQEAALPADGSPLIIEGGTLNEPGFLRCQVWVDVDGRSYRGTATAGLAPEQIRPTQVDPEDFDAFWKKALAELAKVPMEPELTLLPERCTSKVDVYHLSLRTAGRWGGRVYGILCIPKGEGPFPALLQVPGAGVRPYHGDIGLAEQGVITLQIGIHGFAVNMAPEVYRQIISGGALGHHYPVYELDDRDNYYYRRVYQRCVRALDYLHSHPKFNGEQLVVMGHSQGGMLAIVTTALDSRVTAVSSIFPAYCDVTGYLHGRAGGWPHMMRANEDGTPSHHASEAKIRTTAYYDVVNFARRLKAPGHYMWGYNDGVCPPTSMYSAYNVISAPKKLVLALETGHYITPEQESRERAWLLKQLGLGSAN